jgi:hypothetical protein
MLSELQLFYLPSRWSSVVPQPNLQQLPRQGAAQKPAEAPSGSIHFEEWQFMAMLAGNEGHGTLGYNGKTYKFKVTGMGAGGYGVDKLSATGEVYRLKDIADFPGKYSELRGGIVLGKGIGGLLSTTITALLLS